MEENEGKEVKSEKIVEPLKLPLPKLQPYGRIAIFQDMKDLKFFLAILKKKLDLEGYFELYSEETDDDELRYIEVKGIGKIYTVLLFNKSAGRYKAKQVFDIVQKNDNQSAIIYIHKHAIGLFKASVTGRFPTIPFTSLDEFAAYFSSDIAFAEPGKELERDMREIHYHLLQQQKFFAEGGILSKEELEKKSKQRENNRHSPTKSGNSRSKSRSRSRSRSRRQESRPQRSESRRDRSRSRERSSNSRRDRSRSRSRNNDRSRRDESERKPQTQQRRQNGGGYGKHRPSKVPSQKDE